MTTEWISGLRVNDLKEELRKRGLTVSGKKADLVERLTEAVNKTEAPADEDAVAEASPEQAGVDEAEAPSEPSKALGKPEEADPAEAKPAVAEKKLPDAAEVPEEDKISPKHETGAPTEGLTEEDAIKQIQVEAIEEAKAELDTEIQPEVEQKDDSPIPEAEPKTESDVKQQSPEVQTEAQAVPEPEPQQDDTAMPDAPQQTAAFEEEHGRTHKEDLDTQELAEDRQPDKKAESQQNRASTASPEVEPEAEMPASELAEPEGNVAAMQAALLAPEPNAGAVPETAEEEELVDFEADEVAEEPPSATQPKDVSKGLKRASVEPASVSTKTKDKLLSEENSTPSQAPPSKRQRQPIPSFKSLDARSSSRPSAISRSSQDDATPGGRKSVFNRVGSAEEGAPRGSGAPPSRVQATNALLVTGFVRPFTVKAAQGLFEAHGKLVKFWMPMIRDKACAIFESPDSAEAARQALHGLEWPAGSRTSLRPKFISDEEAEQVTSGTGKDLPARGSGLSLKGSGAIAAITDAAAQSAQNPAAKRKPDKVNGEAAQPKRAKVETSKEDTKAEGDEKVLTLEDLFKKTEATPHLYWLPLSAEAIAAKQKSDTSQPEKKAEEERTREEKRALPASAKPEKRVLEERLKDERPSKEGRREERDARDSRNRDGRRQSQR